MRGQRLNASGSPVETVEDLATTVVLSARAAVEVTALELAAKAGCSQDLVASIESGRLEPTLDTVNRLVSSVGLELRAGPRSRPNPAYLGLSQVEVDRVRAEHKRVCEFAAEYGLKPPGPPLGAQPDWDGTDPAPAHMFGAGPTRRDGGGWAAILVFGERDRIKMTQTQLAEAVEIDEQEIARIETGDLRPSVNELQRVLAAMGASLHVRLEVYDTHDDVLHLQALADPERYLRRLKNAEAAFSNAKVSD